LQLCVSFFCCIIWWHPSTLIPLTYSLAFQHAFFLHDFFPECFGILFSNNLTSFSIHLHYQVHVFMEHVRICTVPYSPDAINPYCSEYSLKEFPLEGANTLCSTPIQNSWLNECFVAFTSLTNLDGTKIHVKYWQVWYYLWNRMLDKSHQTPGICHCFLPSIFPVSDCKYLISCRYRFTDSYLVFSDGRFMSVSQNIHKLQQYISLKPTNGHSCISYNNIKTTKSYMLWALLAHHQGVQ